jgi:xanthine/CO dehydrogenase XdhC/CoxF family maturation factor
VIERAIVEAAAKLREAGEPFLVATAICQRGSSYRRAGARLILAGDRRVAGGISGGCLEGDLAKRGWWRTRSTAAVVVTYDSTHDDDADDDDVREAFAVGCNGIVDVLLERPRPDRIDPLAISELCILTQRRAAIATIYRGPATVGARVALVDGDQIACDPTFPEALHRRIAADLAAAILIGESANRVYDKVEIFIEALMPPPRLFVFGTGPDAVPLIGLARQLGWEAIACTPMARPSVRERFAQFVVGTPSALVARVDAAARPVAVVMAHDYDLDRAHLAALLDSRAAYIGVLGPRARTDRMLADLRREADDRLHAPVGLALGAETPQEIALAITGEILAIVAGVPFPGLRERSGPIHPRFATDGPTERISLAGRQRDDDFEAARRVGHG